MHVVCTDLHVYKNALIFLFILQSKNCLERDYSLISLVLAMVKLVNMSCDKLPKEVSLFWN